MDFERHLPFDGCFNFRDLGGYATVDGRTVRPRRLYRADGPHALTDADAAILVALGLRTVIDLRTPDEARDRGSFDAVVPDAQYHDLPLTDVLPDADELPAWVDPAVVARRYRDMLEAASGRIAEVLAILSEPGAYPAMYHCSAGKDRTGIVTAVVLGALGVADETIIADYALSRHAMTRLLAHLHDRYPDASERLAQVAPAMIAAEPETMALLLEGLRRDYGSFDAYAAHVGAAGAPPRLRRALLS